MADNQCVPLTSASQVAPLFQFACFEIRRVLRNPNCAPPDEEPAAISPEIINAC